MNIGKPQDNNIHLSESDIIRFWKFVNKTDSCWLWTGSKDPDYGCFNYYKNNKSITRKAHRCSYVIANGTIPSNMLICHTCDVPACVNPDHLFAGTYKDNAKDRDKKERGALAKLNHNQVKEIRSTCNLLELSKQYNISPHAIIDLLTGKSWKY